LQWFGVGYLCWMGIGLLRAPIEQIDAADEQRKSGWVFLRQACLVSLTNPKVILFFVAFFPLFMRPNSSTMTLLAMMAHVTGISLFYQAGIVLLGNAVARRLRAIPLARKLATRLAGLALVGFGIKLAANNR
jgi:threonine/homoserine/homoserine lactone efflux protein